MAREKLETEALSDFFYDFLISTFPKRRSSLNSAS